MNKGPIFHAVAAQRLFCLCEFARVHSFTGTYHTHTLEPGCATLERTTLHVACFIFAEIMKLNVQIPTVCQQNHAVKHVFSIVGGLASCDKGPGSMSHNGVSNIPN